MRPAAGEEWHCQLPPVAYHNGIGWPMVIVVLPFAFVADVVTLPFQVPLYIYAKFAGTNH